MISVDTKKKELVGDFKNAGREWQPQATPEQVLRARLSRRRGRQGDPVRRLRHGAQRGVGQRRPRPRHAGVRRRLDPTMVEDDGHARLPGGARSSSSPPMRAAATAIARARGSTSCSGSPTTLRLRIRVSHFPPGTSKWNKIEHRLFCHITENWRGRPLRTFETVVDLIGHTRTAAGLRVKAKLDKRRYPTGASSPARRCATSRCTRIRSTATGTTNCDLGQVDNSISIKVLSVATQREHRQRRQWLLGSPSLHLRVLQSCYTSNMAPRKPTDRLSDEELRAIYDRQRYVDIYDPHAVQRMRRMLPFFRAPRATQGWPTSGVATAFCSSSSGPAFASMSALTSPNPSRGRPSAGETRTASPMGDSNAPTSPHSANSIRTSSTSRSRSTSPSISTITSSCGIFRAIHGALKPGAPLYLHTPNAEYFLERFHTWGILKQVEGHVAVRECPKLPEAPRAEWLHEGRRSISPSLPVSGLQA